MDRICTLAAITILFTVAPVLGVGAMETPSNLPAYAKVKRGERDSVPEIDLAWLYFESVHRYEKELPNSGRDMLINDLDLSEVEAQAVVEHVQHSIFDLNESIERAHETTCRKAQKREFLSRKDVAKYLTKLEEQADKLRRKHVSGLRGLLGQEKAQSFNELAKNRFLPGFVSISVDYYEFVETEKIDPATFFLKNC